jgi:hypothetical protein
MRAVQPALLRIQHCRNCNLQLWRQNRFKSPLTWQQEWALHCGAALGRTTLQKPNMAAYLVFSISARGRNPGETVDTGSEIDGRLHLPGAQIEDGNFAGTCAADVGNIPSGAHQDF